MKYIYCLLVLAFLINCSPARNITSKIDGTYVNTIGIKDGVKNECKIIFYKENKFKFTCTYNHLGTSIKGSWEILDNNKIVLKLEEEDVFPTYPEKFYQNIDTCYILNDSSITHNKMIFIRNNNSD